MGKDATVAPKERVNILYKTEIGGAQEEVELPLNILVMGEYNPNVPEDEKSLEDRKTVSVDKDNFNDVLEKQNLGLTASVPDKLSGEKDASLTVELKFKSLNDFGPEAIVNQVPELKKLLELRAALTALKSPLGNVPAFRKKLQSLLGDGESRAKLIAELGIANKDTK
ncbi:MAG TPA: type VI secretion system contractile sheath small subunit [Candidatus Polarisedimenticolaceae bacterium]|nr:type VI secretion system contractile sheath small subunit [Candidatus Polarisedimenticolaceae bacterium]